MITEKELEELDFKYFSEKDWSSLGGFWALEIYNKNSINITIYVDKNDDMIISFVKEGVFNDSYTEIPIKVENIQDLKEIIKKLKELSEFIV